MEAKLIMANDRRSVNAVTILSHRRGSPGHPQPPLTCGCQQQPKMIKAPEGTALQANHASGSGTADIRMLGAPEYSEVPAGVLC